MMITMIIIMNMIMIITHHFDIPASYCLRTDITQSVTDGLLFSGYLVDNMHYQYLILSVIRVKDKTISQRDQGKIA